MKYQKEMTLSKPAPLTEKTSVSLNPSQLWTIVMTVAGACVWITTLWFNTWEKYDQRMSEMEVRLSKQIEEQVSSKNATDSYQNIKLMYHDLAIFSEKELDKDKLWSQMREAILGGTAPRSPESKMKE